VTGSDIVLYLLGENDPGCTVLPSTPIGRFVFRDLQAGSQPTSEGLRPDLEFTRTPGSRGPGARLARLAWLQAKMERTRIPPRRRGELVIEADQRPALGIASNVARLMVAAGA